MLKINLLKFQLISPLFLFISATTFAQTIFHDDINSLITDEDLSGNQIMKLNEFFLTGLHFVKKSDLSYSNPETKEVVTLSVSKKGDQITGDVDYLTTGNRLHDFKNSLNEFTISNNTGDSFTAIYKENKNYAIALLKDDAAKNKSLKHLRFSFNFDVKDKENEPLFPVRKIYPLQYSTWNLDFELQLLSSEDSTFESVLTLKKNQSDCKIEFLDKSRFRVDYFDKNKKQQSISGTYSSSEYTTTSGGIYNSVEGPSVSFSTEKQSPLVTKLAISEKVDFKNLSRVELLDFLLSMNYHISAGKKEFVLTNTINLNPKVYDVAPANFQIKE